MRNWRYVDKWYFCEPLFVLWFSTLRNSVYLVFYKTPFNNRIFVNCKKVQAISSACKPYKLHLRAGSERSPCVTNRTVTSLECRCCMGFSAQYGSANARCSGLVKFREQCTIISLNYKVCKLWNNPIWNYFSHPQLPLWNWVWESLPVADLVGQWLWVGVVRNL